MAAAGLRAAVLAALLAAAAAAQPAAAASRVAAAMACRDIKAMADRALGRLGPVACLPAEAEAEGRFDLVLVARRDVFATTPTRRIFVLVAAKAAGLAVNTRYPETLAGLWLTDRDLAAERRGYVLPAAVAAETQAALDAGRLSLEDMYFRLESEMHPYSLPPAPEDGG